MVAFHMEYQKTSTESILIDLNRFHKVSFILNNNGYNVVWRDLNFSVVLMSMRITMPLFTGYMFFGLNIFNSSHIGQQLYKNSTIHVNIFLSKLSLQQTACTMYQQQNGPVVLFILEILSGLV